MISNLTLHEIKMFFSGKLIDELKDEIFYVQKVQKNKYSVKDMDGNDLGYIHG